MSLVLSYSPNYFSIDDILASQERTPCKFLTNVPKLGKLNPASEDDDLAAGTSLELPIWLVQPLSSGRHAIIAADLPRIYTEPYREILKADPVAVDLHKFNLYFYEFGLYAKSFDIRGDVATTLIYTFITRFRKIMDLADNMGLDPLINDGLDMLERGLFFEGHKARTKLNNWLIQTGMQLEAANMVTNHKKRKRVNLEDII
ncbi:PREDICTED: DNA replication complex GINS protein PSF3 [Nicrophorus vespilloides]|uniref:DNA replication complex GINS protein PSF3 n=1 Tax=Nicrophorus vespilloides TaxID=110193 RepID=A0ABM1NE49_NICVS|nr:PREDICTED: DNA replication complex GINS protein PSF3 [Nicrophorus vespilloides]